MRTRAGLPVVAVAAAVGALTRASPAQAAFPGKNGRIAAPGSGRRVLGACPAGDCFQT